MSDNFDSLGATEFIRTLGAYFSINLAPTALFDHPTIDSLSRHLEYEVYSDDRSETMPRRDQVTSARNVLSPDF